MAGPEVIARAPDVALVWEGYGDGCWGDAMGEGFDRAVDELGLRAERRLITPQSRDPLAPELRRLSEEGTSLIVVGTASEDLAGTEAVADEHPDCRYIAVDVVGDPHPNLTYVDLGEEEGAFLAGAAAALKSETGIVGFIGGKNNSLIVKFSTGFEAGARRVRPGIDVRVLFLSVGSQVVDRVLRRQDAGYLGFADPRKASREAERLFDEGADVIHAAAGSSGFGVFDAAARRSGELGSHLWVIGVDTDQYRMLAQLPDVPEETVASWRPHILTSLVKRYDVVLSAVLGDHVRGASAAGVRRFGLADGATELAYSGGFIDDIRPEIEDLRRRIVEGEIVVPAGLSDA
jgi:basic membrane protein A